MSCSRCQSTARPGGAAQSDPPRARSGVSAMPPRYGIATADRSAAAASGRALDPGVRAQFEGRMGADFSGVRIHDGGEAAASAQAIGARAYTIGTDIRFAPGQFRPDTPAGQRLIAHELTHVVQQGGQPVGPQAKLRAGQPGDAFEREADSVADIVAAGGSAAPALKTAPMVQMDGPKLLDQQLKLRPINIAPPMLIPRGSIPESWVIPKLPAPPEIKLEMPAPSVGYKKPPLLPPTPQLQMDPKLRFTPVDIIPVPRCDPDRPLTWADFPGNSVPAGFGGVTRVVTPLLNIDGNPMFQSQLNQKNKSAVEAKFRTPGERAKNGCAKTVDDCKTKGKGNWAIDRPKPADDTCPAAILPVAAASTIDECETVIGTACDAAAQLESDRLLAHEQLHFDISCTLVGKANDALRAGTHTPAQLTPWLQSNQTTLQKKYDDESNHGCKPAQQASWVADVAGGLSAVALPAVAAPTATHP
jgi:hypothetical protein